MASNSEYRERLMTMDTRYFQLPDVLEEEYLALRPRTVLPPPDPAADDCARLVAIQKRMLNDDTGLAALCLSGGGIQRDLRTRRGAGAGEDRDTGTLRLSVHRVGRRLSRWLVERMGAASSAGHGGRECGTRRQTRGLACAHPVAGPGAGAAFARLQQLSVATARFVLHRHLDAGGDLSAGNCCSTGW